MKRTRLSTDEDQYPPAKRQQRYDCSGKVTDVSCCYKVIVIDHEDEDDTTLKKTNSILCDKTLTRPYSTSSINDDVIVIEDDQYNFQEIADVIIIGYTPGLISSVNDLHSNSSVHDVVIIDDDDEKVVNVPTRTVSGISDPCAKTSVKKHPTHNDDVIIIDDDDDSEQRPLHDKDHPTSSSSLSKGALTTSSVQSHDVIIIDDDDSPQTNHQPCDHIITANPYRIIGSKNNQENKMCTKEYHCDVQLSSTKQTSHRQSSSDNVTRLSDDNQAQDISRQQEMNLQSKPKMGINSWHQLTSNIGSSTTAQTTPNINQDTNFITLHAINELQQNHMMTNPHITKSVSTCGLDEVAIDCEMADVSIGPGGKAVKVMISVAIVDSLLKLIYYAVCPPPGWNTVTCRSELVVPRTRRFPPLIIQQFQEAALKGVTFDGVRAQVAAILSGKRVIGHSLDCDLRLMGLRLPRERAYDTHYHYSYLRCCQLGFLGKIPWRNRGQGFSLKFITMLLLGQSIQTGPHDAVEDSTATIALYLYDKGMFKSMAELGLMVGLRNGRMLNFDVCYY